MQCLVQKEIGVIVRIIIKHEWLKGAESKIQATFWYNDLIQRIFLPFSCRSMNIRIKSLLLGYFVNIDRSILTNLFGNLIRIKYSYKFTHPSLTRIKLP